MDLNFDNKEKEVEPYSTPNSIITLVCLKYFYKFRYNKEFSIKSVLKKEELFDLNCQN